MWYVNYHIVPHLTLNALEFYINYVVCKFANSNEALLSIVSCFILTMWYVNVTVVYELAEPHYVLY